MVKEKRSWQQIAEEQELWVGRAVRPVNINLAGACEANLARITTECRERDKEEKGKKLKPDEQEWKDVAMEYVRVNQLKVASKNVVTIAGLNADNVRLGKEVKIKKEKKSKQT